MTLSAPTLLGAVATIFGVIGILSASLVVSRAATVRSNLELLRGEVSDLTASNARLSGENKELHEEVGVLRELVTSRAQVDQLAGEVHAVLEHLRADHGGVLDIYQKWIRDAWSEDEHSEGGERFGPGGRVPGPSRPEGRKGGPPNR